MNDNKKISENIEKPMTMIRQEFVDKLVDDINNCGLPLFVIETILKELYLEVKSMSQKQSEIEKMQYEKKLREYNSEDK